MKAQRKQYHIKQNTLSFLEAGDPTNHVILFLHGIPANAELWRQTIEKVSDQHYYCLAPDLPGYGYTEIKDKTYYRT